MQKTESLYGNYANKIFIKEIIRISSDMNNLFARLSLCSLKRNKHIFLSTHFIILSIKQ